MSSTEALSPFDPAAAQRAMERSDYLGALTAARAATEGVAEPSTVLEALRVRATAAFRLGELAEAADTTQRMVAVMGRDAGTEALRIEVLAISVVAAGELARYEQSIEHLKLMQSAAARAGTLSDFVRARGTAANCFALLGDPWAGQRLLSELAGMFLGGLTELRLEATVRTNHASVCLVIARLARHGGDEQSCREALEHAQASIERARELARVRGDMRVAAFADVHASELALLSGHPQQAIELLNGALAGAEDAQLWAHARQLRLLEAEAWLALDDAARAREHLDHVGATLNAGHELAARVRYHLLMERCLCASGDLRSALTESTEMRRLYQYRQYQQSSAQSRFLRTRLELEHLYRYRGGHGAGGAAS